MAPKNQACPVVPFYFPLTTGRYEVKAGLYKFPYDFGNGESDRQIFQIDQTFEDYRQAKQTARAEHLDKYYCCDGFDASAAAVINRFIVRQLVTEHPTYFRLRQQGGKSNLACGLTREKLTFDRDCRFQPTSSQISSQPVYQDGFDALANQIQEDMAVIRLKDTGEDQIIAIHLCLPNHWAAQAKIGHCFAAAHRPVPGMDKINQSAGQLLHAIMQKGPYVRFAWGLATDRRLNHHPQAAPEQEHWHGRAFDPLHPMLYLRVERQTLHGFPTARLALFTIRTYFYDVHALASHPARKSQLINAINSMSDASLDYKGLAPDKKAIIKWLKNRD